MITAAIKEMAKVEAVRIHAMFYLFVVSEWSLQPRCMSCS